MFYDLPVRLGFPDAATDTGPHFRIIVYGAFFSDWNPALVDPKLWRAIPGVTEVVRVIHASQIRELGPTSANVRTVIIPLGDEHTRQCPREYLSLIPDGVCVDILGNKARFASFMDEAGLSALCPKTYRNEHEVEFPCVLKRLNQNGAYGVELVQTARQLGALLKTDVFSGQEHLLQAFVPGETEYATHCVCKDGQILWSCSFSRDMGPVPRIGGLDHDMVRPIELSQRARCQIASVLASLRYSGPCCVDYKLSESGDVVIFEINPRFGGSLMISTTRDFLGQALRHIVSNARQPAQPGQPRPGPSDGSVEIGL